MEKMDTKNFPFQLQQCLISLATRNCHAAE